MSAALKENIARKDLLKYILSEAEALKDVRHNPRIPTAGVLRYICAYIQKGEVRNTVLRQIKNLERSLNLLNQGRSIKEQEIKEYKSKKPSKARKLKKQVSIITHGLRHIIQALNELQKYKKTTSR